MAKCRVSGCVIISKAFSTTKRRYGFAKAWIHVGSNHHGLCLTSTLEILASVIPFKFRVSFHQSSQSSSPIISHLNLRHLSSAISSTVDAHDHNRLIAVLRLPVDDILQISRIYFDGSMATPLHMCFWVFKSTRHIQQYSIEKNSGFAANILLYAMNHRKMRCHFPPLPLLA